MYPRHLARGRVARRGQTVTPDLADRTRERIRDLVGAIAAEEFEFSPDRGLHVVRLQEDLPPSPPEGRTAVSTS